MLTRRMALEVRLLGPPSIICDGVAVPLNGPEALGLLAYLLLEQRLAGRAVVYLSDRVAPPVHVGKRRYQCDVPAYGRPMESHRIAEA